MAVNRSIETFFKKFKIKQSKKDLLNYTLNNILKH
jgi:hypothetical protein